MSDETKKAPERIDCDSEGYWYSDDDHGVSWVGVKPYVRADIYDAVVAERDGYKERAVLAESYLEDSTTSGGAVRVALSKADQTVRQLTTERDELNRRIGLVKNERDKIAEQYGADVLDLRHRLHSTLTERDAALAEKRIAEKLYWEARETFETASASIGRAHAKETAELRKAAAQAAQMRGALEDIATGPEPVSGYLTGVRCGVEDRGLQNHVYAAAEYGYEEGLKYCADIAGRALADAAPVVEVEVTRG